MTEPRMIKDAGDKEDVTVAIKGDSVTLEPTHVEVTVRSRTRPASLMEGSFDLATTHSPADARLKVETLAGALAERICERLGDNLLDPDTCARTAGRCWDEAYKRMQN